MLKTRAQKVRIEFKFSEQILTVFFALSELRVVGILLLPYDWETFEDVSDRLIIP